MLTILDEMLSKTALHFLSSQAEDSECDYEHICRTHFERQHRGLLKSEGLGKAARVPAIYSKILQRPLYM